MKLLSGTRGGVQANVRRVNISNVTGLAIGKDAFWAGLDYDTNNPALPAGAGEVEDITITGVRKLRCINGNALLHIGQTRRYFLIEGVAWDDTSVSAPLAEVTVTGSIDVLSFRGIRAANSPSQVKVEGHVGRLLFDDCVLIAKALITSMPTLLPRRSKMCETTCCCTPGRGLWSSSPRRPR